VHSPRVLGTAILTIAYRTHYGDLAGMHEPTGAAHDKEESLIYEGSLGFRLMFIQEDTDQGRANGLFSTLRRAYSVGRWLIAPGSGPGPGFYKRWVIRRSAKRARTPILVETGTLHGKTVSSCLKSFSQIISIEIEPALASKAKERFANESHVRIVQGDSAVELTAIVEGLKSPATYWLDGHYSGPGTGRGILDSPVVAEIKTVLGSGKPALVLVDDARHFTGADGYPTLAELREMVRILRPLSTFTVSRDIVRINAMMAF